jgi:hypothetical protein
VYENLLNSTDKSAKSGHFGGGFLFIAFNKKVSYNVAMEAFYGKKKNDQDCCMAVDRYLMCRQYPNDNESGRTLTYIGVRRQYCPRIWSRR